MKLVPSGIDGVPDGIVIQSPEGTCVGCASATDDKYEFVFRKSLTRYKVQLPMCKKCQRMELSRQALRERADSAATRSSSIAFATVGVIGLIAAISLGFATPLGWWAGLLVVVALVAAMKASSLAYGTTHKKLITKIHQEWISQHPELPDPTRGAISFHYSRIGPVDWREKTIKFGRWTKLVDWLLSKLRVRDAKPRFVREVYRTPVENVRCQCDAFADLLIKQPYHAMLQKMVEGEVPVARVIDSLPRNRSSRLKSDQLIESIDLYQKAIPRYERDAEKDKGTIYEWLHVKEMVDAYLHIAKAQEFLGDLEQAHSSTESAVQVARSNGDMEQTLAQALFNRGLLRARLGRESDAHNDFVEALKLAPELGSVER